MLRPVLGSASHVGLVRDHNEDSLLAHAQVAVVADGMGGHAAGEVASRLAVARMAALGDRADDGIALSPDDVRTALDSANEDILASAIEHAEQSGMGTTITGLAVVSIDGTEQWAVFNVGDSRVYRFADDALTQLTVDHSEVQELVAAGTLTAEQAKTYFRRNVVTRSLGSNPAPVPDIWVLPPTPGERFVVCSDGLTLELTDEQVAEILRSTPDTRQAAESLVAQAVSAGGRDNVSVVVVDLPAR